MGLCLCTHAQAQAFADKKINARHRHNDLLTTTELAKMISEVYPAYRKKAASYIVNEHRKRQHCSINSPTSCAYVSSVFLSSSEFSSHRRGRRATRRCRARPAHVLQPVATIHQPPTVAMVLDKEDT